jgi:peptidoglycan/xylan/chitin deacetylase (PgdA/CDA1 family)
MVPPSTPLGSAYISLDFDDGYLSSFEHALPIINGAGFKTTQYIITGSLSKPGRVSLAQVRAMQAAGNEIGAHTRTHPYLTRVSAQQAMDEICGSRKDLIALGITPKTFAYPEGDYNPTIESIAMQAGFAGARATRGGLNNATTDLFALRSYQTSASTTLPEMKYVIDQAIANKEWLTIVFHKTDELGSYYNTSSQLIRGIVAYLQSTQVPVITESQGLSIINGIRGNANDIRKYTPTNSLQ